MYQAIIIEISRSLCIYYYPILFSPSLRFEETSCLNNPRILSRNSHPYSRWRKMLGHNLFTVWKLASGRANRNTTRGGMDDKLYIHRYWTLLCLGGSILPIYYDSHITPKSCKYRLWQMPLRCLRKNLQCTVNKKCRISYSITYTPL